MIAKLKNYLRYRKARKRFIILINAVDGIDSAFKLKGISRHDRRQFWQEFIHNPESRAKTLEDMRKGFGL